MFQTGKYYLNDKCSVTVKQCPYLMLLKDEDRVYLTKSETRELPHPFASYRRLVSSVQRRPACQARGPELKPRTRQQSGFLKNW